ncbi:hypothetical protein RSOLAG22IIIB_07368 [Rhizoctonia solani]|uniref:Uncharacterized protein n=1 Tax=Rhizoctonia solani TaxID=456999 RepID=A0A0K6FM45_9AGAM|nr:hypothetical protein RSOLAG22IIIB_07368 [Rhizoctonia solani]
MAFRNNQSNNPHDLVRGSILSPESFNAVDEDIAKLRRLQFSSETRGTIGDIITDLKGRQVEHIKTLLSPMVLESLQLTKDLNALVRKSRALDAGPVNPSNDSKENASLAPILEHWIQAYNDLLSVQRGCAISLSGTKCIKGIKDTARGLRDDNIREGDAVSKLASLIQGLLDIQIFDCAQLKELAEQTTQGKPSTESQIGIFMDYLDMAIRPGETPTSSSEHVLTSGSKGGRYKNLGSRASLILKNRLKSFQKQRSDRDVNGTRASGLHSPNDPSTNQISPGDKSPRPAMVESTSYGDQWQSILQDMKELENRVLNFTWESSLVLTQIKEMVRSDCLNYIGFIGAPWASDPELKLEEIRRMNDWAHLYDGLQQPLAHFANGTVSSIEDAA